MALPSPKAVISASSLHLSSLHRFFSSSTAEPQRMHPGTAGPERRPLLSACWVKPAVNPAEGIFEA